MLSLTVAAALTAPASAEAGSPQGRGCGWLVTNAGGAWQGVLAAGPVSAPGSVVEVTCEVVSWETHAVVASVASGPRQDVAFAADVVTYPESDLGEYLCTTVVVDGTSWRQGDDGTWTPGGRSCRESLRVPPPPDQCLSLECGPLGFLYGALDRTLCPVFATLPDVPGVVEFADDGDIDVAGEPFWDCPPYDVS